MAVPATKLATLSISQEPRDDHLDGWMMTITLIGYRGCGKSSVAPALAERLACDWQDADVVVEAQAGRSIRSIFAEHGEAEFRRLERATLLELLQNPRLIIAAGGGAILNDATRRDLRRAGPVVWLRASVETIQRRIAEDPLSAERRPALAGRSATDEIATVLKQREPLYEDAATDIIWTDQRSIAEIVDDIMQRIPADWCSPAAIWPGEHS